MKSVLGFALALASLVLIGCGTNNKSADVESTPTPPNPLTAGSGVTFSSVTATGFTATWGAASDTSAATNTLEYQLVYSASNNVSTVATALANGTVAMAYTAATLTAPVTGLTGSTTYYVAVIVKDADGNTALSTGNQLTLCAGKAIWLVSVPNGNLGGISGADGICTSNLPSGVTGSAKAMLVDGVNRYVCDNTGHCDAAHQADWSSWLASRNLCSADFTQLIGTTNANGVLGALTNPVSNSATQAYTGFAVSMGSADAADSCNGWTTTGGGPPYGNLGDPTSTGSGIYLTGRTPFSLSCNSASKIICVQL